ncbi:hypothetical protein M9458_013527, partial [Cirrhinus mrigala]
VPMEIGLTLMANKSPRAPQIMKLLDWEDNRDEGIARKVIRQVFHWDIKTENLLLNRDTIEIKLINFG